MRELFEKVSGPIDFPADEKRILAFWKDSGIFAKTLTKNEGKESFVFFEGPPTANGTPHNGHVLTRVIKDLFPRYKTMRGYNVPRKAGWDTHGLPVEVEVEKELGIHGKEAIIAYGVEAFTKKCIESVFRYTDVWEQLTERIGFWVDLSDAYVTFHEQYVESVWWALSELFKKGLLYQGHKVVWWWPQGGTALSAAEVGLGYKTVDDPSVFVRFPVVGDLHGAPASFLAWTTTPWTLPSNCALAVHPGVTYAIVTHMDGDTAERLIVAEPLIEKLFGEGVTPDATMSGAELVGLKYAPPFDFATPETGLFSEVISASFVTTDSGSGIVHVAPGYGVDDFAAAAEHGVGLLQLVGTDGRFSASCGELAGRFCKEADRDIIRNLKKRGLLFKEEVYRHDYPFCWRADSDPLIQFARPAWFIRTTSVTDKALANNAQINWVPEHIRDGRFGDWLRNNVDWALSRERFWGTPLNLWRCPDCGHTEAPPSVAAILAKNPRAFDAFDAAKAADPELSTHLRVHKPWIDDVTLPCSACNSHMVRVPEVIDCWFDSGCMPFAQWGWPHRGHDKFDIAFPADFISEAVDQTRGWFYSLLMISTLLFGDDKDGAPRKLPHPFKTCIVLGHVTDKTGKKESKSKGNYTPPDKILDTDGADAMRWYFYAANPPWNSTRYSPENVRLGQQEFLVKLRNVYSFFTIYAEIDSFDPRTSPRRAPADRSTLDRWMVSEFHRALRDVTAMMDDWKPYDAAQRIIELTDALSNWYVRRSRDRFWAAADAPAEVVADKWDAYHTLYEVLVGMSQLAAPFVPFISDVLWQNLVRRPYPAAAESVHLSDWPAFDLALIDEGLSEDMAAVRDIVGLGLQARNANRLKVRQPLQKVEVILGNPKLAETLAQHVGLITDELNVKEVAFTQNATHVEFQLKLNFRALGPIYGARVQLVKRALDAVDPKEARRSLALTGSFTVDLEDGETTSLTADLVSVSVTPAEGFVASAGSVGVVILETALSEALISEGLSREVLSRIQGWRKQANLDYTARIRVVVEGDAELVAACQEHMAFICRESLADALEFGPAVGDEVRDEAIDGRAMKLGLSVAAK